MVLLACADLSQLATCRLVAAASAVCTSLRTAVLAPGSHELWSSLTFKSSHAGLSAQQCAGYQALLKRQGHHARSVSLRGGGWALDDLQSILASLTGLSAHVDVYKLHSAQEAALIGCALASRPIPSLSLSGTVACALPPNIRQLHLMDVSFTHWKDEDDAERRLLVELLLQSHSQALLRSLQPLSLVEDLTLALPLWRMTENNIDSLARLPALSKLHLAISASSLLGPHSAGHLRQLSSAVCLDVSIVQLSVNPDESLELLLWQLAEGCVRLHTLHISYEDLSVAEEAALAGCCITGELVLRLHGTDRHLAHPPPGVPVVYTQL